MQEKKYIQETKSIKHILKALNQIIMKSVIS